MLNGHLGHLVEPKLLHFASAESQANQRHSTPARLEHDAGGRGSPEPPEGAGTDPQPYRDARYALPELQTIGIVGQTKRRRDTEQPTGEQE